MPGRHAVVTQEKDAPHFGDVNIPRLTRAYIGPVNGHDYLGIYAMAGNLLPEMARISGFGELGRMPTEAALASRERGLVKHFGGAATFQDNIRTTREQLGLPAASSIAVSAGMVRRSRIMEPRVGSFIHGQSVPESVDKTVVQSAVGRWMMRRADMLIDFAKDASRPTKKVGEVVIAAGSRQMKEGEHKFVADLAQVNGELPTERDFSRQVVGPYLEAAGFIVRHTDAESTVGENVVRSIAEAPGLMDGTVLAAVNVPSVTHVAGQMRMGLREVDKSFDWDGEQFFVLATDTRDLALSGESAATHQNPEAAVGAVARDALWAHNNARDWFMTSSEFAGIREIHNPFIQDLQGAA
ncbi:MAG TPA: hypothetical protein VIM53_04155 [Candidatus Saccharimonadales bacterium]